MELPIAFEARMRALLKTEYEAFHAALDGESAVKGLRVNAHKVSPEVFSENAPFPLTRISYVDGGFIVSEEDSAGKHPYHAAGAYYMQDPGAMATVAALPDEILRREGIRVLDVCSAPGGKTTQLAAAADRVGGVVLANEYNAARSRILAGNVERLGLSNVLVTNLDTKYLGEWYPGGFDLVVCDAPCSGEGMFRKNDRAVEEWSEGNVTMCAERQSEILSNIADTVAVGGYLLYSTCTYSVEENEAVVWDFLSRHADFSLVPVREEVVRSTSDGVTEGFSEELRMTRRFYPHVSRGEGQFLALLHRNEGGRSRGSLVKDAAKPLSKEDARAVDAFLMETIGRTEADVILCGGNATLMSNRRAVGLPIGAFGAVAIGAVIGEVRKGRIVPHHHFFTAFGTEMKSRAVLDPDDPRVAAYVAGEEIDVPSECKGYTAVLLRVGDACITLGGGKASGGRLKNYYPKGLRVR